MLQTAYSIFNTRKRWRVFVHMEVLPADFLGTPANLSVLLRKPIFSVLVMLGNFRVTRRDMRRTRVLRGARFPR